MLYRAGAHEHLQIYNNVNDVNISYVYVSYGLIFGTIFNINYIFLEGLVGGGSAWGSGRQAG